MTSDTAQLVISVWEAVRDHLPHTKRDDVAKDLLFAFAEFGFEAAELAPVADEDPDLAEAYDEVFPSTEYDDYDEEDDDIEE